MSILVTGATGFVGSVVARRLVAEGEDVVGLVRGDPARLPFGVRRLSGDLSKAIEPPSDVDAVVHCAASVSFTLPLEEARAVNVAGTQRVLDAAARLPRLERFVHVSTAFVAGTCVGAFGEDDWDVGQDFRNTYEQTKHEAEEVVRESGLPARIVRPSIVVGDSATGWTSSFNVLYAPLQAFSRGLVRRVPADPHAVLDVVPVDHVADVIIAALREPGDGTLHAVSADRATTARELAELAAAAFGRPAPEFDPEAETLPGLDQYFPYFSVGTRFTADRSRSLGLAPPALPEYFDHIVDFAQRARWGRQPIAA
jgi:nucleoside-diphosphate-sugar epimerase